MDKVDWARAKGETMIYFFILIIAVSMFVLGFFLCMWMEDLGKEGDRDDDPWNG